MTTEATINTTEMMNWKTTSPFLREITASELVNFPFNTFIGLKNYESESRQANLINYFTLVAIIISCLGLFGLTTFTAEQRTKEIGIRKVLGASVYGLVALLSRDFLKLVIIAMIIAFPLSWYVMKQWLQNFAYQTSITWTVFALTSCLALLIAFVTISFQAIKAAVSNPVKSLRTE